MVRSSTWWRAFAHLKNRAARLFECSPSKRENVAPTHGDLVEGYRGGPAIEKGSGEHLFAFGSASDTDPRVRPPASPPKALVTEQRVLLASQPRFFLAQVRQGLERQR